MDKITLAIDANPKCGGWKGADAFARPTIHPQIRT